MNGRTWGVWAAGAGLLLLVLAVAFACAGGSATAANDDDTGGGGDDSGDDTGDCGTPDLLTGVWTTASLTLSLFGDNTFHAVGANQAGYDVQGVWSVDGCVIRFTDAQGTGACPSSQVGQYDYVVTQTTFTTTLKSDDCAGRSTGLDGTVFHRGS